MLLGSFSTDAGVVLCRSARPRRANRHERLAAVSVLAATLVACGGTTGTSSTPAASAPVVSVSPSAPNVSDAATTATMSDDALHLVVIGDSIPYGDICPGCVGFVDQYAQELGTRTGRTVDVANRSRNDSATLADIKTQVVGDGALREEVATADVVIVSVGFNDQAPWPSDRPCQARATDTLEAQVAVILELTETCVAETISSYRADYEDVFEEIATLVPDEAALLALTVYNNALGYPGIDDVVGPVDLDRVSELTRRVVDGWNEMMCDTGAEYGFACVDVYHAFNGADGTEPAGDALLADYAHPSQRGNDVIASLLTAIDLRTLVVPGSGSATPITGLPPEPLVLYEWYPAGENSKSIIASDAGLTARPVRMVPESDGAAIHAGWSRDGSQFAWEVLRGDRTASVWTANADGSDPAERVVCAAAPCLQMSYPAFSPDDVQLLVTQFDLADDGDWGPSHLVVVDLATGEQTVIASTADGTTAFYSATWSPDGAHVAAALETYTDATEDTRTGSAIVVVDTDPATNAPPTPVTDPDLYAGYPRWHPTDDRILFASWDLHAYQGDEASQLYTVGGDGSRLTQITNVDYPTAKRRPGEASWTPDGEGIIASIGVVLGGSVSDVKIAWIDPTTGAIAETDASGAMPTLQPRARVDFEQ